MKKPRILIAEDERIVVLDLRKRLLTLGYEVADVVSTASECIEAIVKAAPDLVLMDIILKGDRDGISTAAEIKERFGLPVVYLTAHTDDKTIQRAKITEPYGYIIKPFEIKDLQTTLELALYRARMEAKLSESELKYRTLVQTATDAVLIVDVNGIVTSVNQKTLQMFGYELADFIGTSIKKILPDVFVNHLEHGVKRFLEVGKPVAADVLELTARNSGGYYFPVEIAFSSWNNRSQLFFTLIIRDITRRKQIEEDLKKAHDLLALQVEERTIELQALIDQSPLGIALFQLEGKIIYANNVWKELWNQDAIQLQWNLYNLFSDPVLIKTGYTLEIERILKEGGSFSTGELYLAPEDYPEIADAEGVVVILHFYTVRVTNQKSFRIVVIVENVTDKIKALDASKEVEEQKDRLGTFVDLLEVERSRISRELHDGVGQILSAIKLNIEVYEKSAQTGGQPLLRAKELLTSANRELRSIIYSLHPVYLDNGGLEAAVQTLCSETMKSTPLDIRLISELRAQRFQPKVELTAFRIIQEVINNAVKYSMASFLEIRILHIADILDMYMRDDGVGFDAAELLKRKEVQGFGLIGIRERVEALHGTFHIESSPGRGVELFINIPVEELL